MLRSACPEKLAAIVAGEKRFKKSEPCATCKTNEWWTCNGVCLECGRRKKKVAYDALVSTEDGRLTQKAFAFSQYEKHKVARKAQGRAWHENNRENQNARRKALYHARFEREQAAHRKWRDNNRERKAASDAAWVRANPIKVAARSKKWAAANKEKVRLYVVHRRARKASADGTYTLADLADIRARQNDTCVACKVDLTGAGELDHIEPISLGGSNWPSNLQFLCRACNRRKFNHPMDVFLAELTA